MKYSLFRPQCVNICHISHEIIPWDITKAGNLFTKVNSNGNTNFWGNMSDMVHIIVADDTSILCTTSTWKGYICTVKYGLILSQEICKCAAQTHPFSDIDKVPLRDHAYRFQSYMSVPVELFRYLIWQGIIIVISHFVATGLLTLGLTRLSISVFGQLTGKQKSESSTKSVSHALYLNVSVRANSRKGRINTIIRICRYFHHRLNVILIHTDCIWPLSISPINIVPYKPTEGHGNTYVSQCLLLK